MHHFFVKPEAISGTKVEITGPDVNHIKNALRMKAGERFRISDGTGRDYLCALTAFCGDRVEAEILSQEESRELPVRICLFQGLPKGDKMELIIQKAVELGVSSVVPMATQNAVVKLDTKKEAAKRARWQAIAESAAKQSGRSVIPKISPMLSFSEAARQAGDFSQCWIPYENERGMAGTGEAFAALDETVQSLGVFIGPEGGFDEREIALAREHGIRPISLGRRILRTETAGLAVLSAIMLKLEGAFHSNDK